MNFNDIANYKQPKPDQSISDLFANIRNMKESPIIEYFNKAYDNKIKRKTAIDALKPHKELLLATFSAMFDDDEYSTYYAIYNLKVLYSVSDKHWPELQTEIVNILNKFKAKIIKAILTFMTTDGMLMASTITYTLTELGLDWPELVTIKNSIEHDRAQIREAKAVKKKFRVFNRRN